MLLNCISCFAVFFVGGVLGRTALDVPPTIIMRIMESSPLFDDDHEQMDSPCSIMQNDEDDREMEEFSPPPMKDEYDGLHKMLWSTIMRSKETSKRYIAVLRENIKLKKAIRSMKNDARGLNSFHMPGFLPLSMPMPPPAFGGLLEPPPPMPDFMEPRFLDLAPPRLRRGLLEPPQQLDLKKIFAHKQFAELRKLARNILENFEERRKRFFI